MRHPYHLSVRLIGEYIADAVAVTCEQFQLGRELLLVADENTYAAFGEKIKHVLAATHTVHSYLLPKNSHAEKSLAETISHAAASHTGLLAVGAGTVNDLTKYAAHQCQRPYIAIGTAASMNGYSSASASLSDQGVKTSYLATPPRAALMDLDVIKAAPKRLTRAGLADTLVRTTVEADCLLSHYLLGTPYPKEEFDALRTREPVLLHESIRLVENDKTYLQCLIEALLDAGDAMASTGSSAIASQGEHMIAHTAEMLYPTEVQYLLHGELVGVSAIALSHLQQKCLLGTPLLKPLAGDADTLTRLFGKYRAPRLLEAYAKKILTADAAAEINRKLEKDWPEIKTHIRKIAKSPITLERAFLQANLPVVPKDIKLDAHHFTTAMTYAHFSRERFGFLDLAAMNGKRI